MDFKKDAYDLQSVLQKMYDDIGRLKRVFDIWSESLDRIDKKIEKLEANSIKHPTLNSLKN